VALASNYGASPEGTYYTAVLHLSDGSTSTEYWLVPTTATAEIGGVRTKIMPAYVAARSVNKQYVDTAMAAYSAGLIPATGGSMSGPLMLSGDPVASKEASTKHYVDQAVTGLLPLSGGTLQGPITLPGDPTASLQAATKQYVDAVVLPESRVTNLAADLAAKAPLISPSFTSPTATADPTASLGLATKQYVDAVVLPESRVTNLAADLAAKAPLVAPSFTSPTATADPTASLGLATKQYVDAVVLPESRVTNLAADLAAKAPLVAPSFTSPTATADPTASLGLATKQYVDAHAGADATKLPLAGGALSGSLTLNANPDNASPSLQAATKQFVMNHGEISVTDFGAVGDWATDNKAAFNAAVLYAKTNGKTLYVPAGNYYLSNAVDFRGVSMRGVPVLGSISPVGSTLIGSACHDVIASPDGVEGGSKQMGDNYFTIRDLTILVDASRDATAQFNSVVNTSGNTVTWVSGSKFACLINGPGTPTVRINGTTYNVSSATDTTITTDTSVGTLTNATLWSAGTFVNRKRWALQRSAFSNNPGAAGWTGQTVGASKAIGATTMTLAITPTMNSSWGVAANGAVLIAGTNVCNYYGIVGAVLQNVTCGQQGTTDAVANIGDAVVPVNPWLYTDTADDFPGAEVGNVGIAFPQRDANASHNGLTGATIENVRVLRVDMWSGTGNKTGGLYTQILPYAAHFKNFHARGTTFGFIEAQSAVDIDREIYNQTTQDAAVFEGFEIHSPVPFVGVSGNFVSMNNFQLYSGTDDAVKVPSRGLILLMPTDPSCPICGFKNLPMGDWDIRNMYNEPGYSGLYYGPYAQIQGGMMRFNTGLMGSQPGPVLWDASTSTTDSVSMTSAAAPALIINGAGNKFRNAGINTTVGEVVDNSQGGTEWSGNHSYGVKDSFQVPARFGPANRIDGAFARTMSFGADTYQSGDGLFVSPENMFSWLSPTNAVVHDSTAPVTGTYLVLPAHPGVSLLGRLNGYDAWHVGSTFPKGTGTLVAMFRAVSTTSGTLQSMWNSGTLASQTCSLTAGVWTACTVPYDTTSIAIGSVIKIGGAWNGTDNAFSPATEIDVAYVAAVPDFTTLNATNLNAVNLTVTNPITLPGSPSTANQAANKGYVDTSFGGFGLIPSGIVNDSWPMHDGSGTTFAEASARNTITVTGTGSWGTVSGFTGSSYTFNGSGHGTAANLVTTNFDGTTPFSVSGKFKLSTFSGNPTIVSTLDISANGYKGWEVSLDTTGHITFYLINTFPTYAIAVTQNCFGLTANQIYNFAVTYSGSRLASGVKLYVNGSACSFGTTYNTLSGTTGTTASGLPMVIGSRTDGVNTASGVISDLQITNTVLTAQQAAALANGPFSESQVTNLVADLAAKALGTTTVNGHAISSNVVVSASDLTTGTLPASAEPAHTGDVTNTAGSVATTVRGLNGVLLSSLATCLLKNTTTTGLPSCAVSGTDYAPVASPTFTTQVTAPKFIGVIAGETDVAFSATPTFVATSNLNYISLTGNVTSSTLAAGANGQTINLIICQDATGSRTFVWPTTVRGGGTIGSTASTCSSQRFTYVGALSKWVSAGAIQTGL